MENKDKKNIDRSNKEIQKNVMLYPNERVVAAIARNFKDVRKNIGRNGLDIGFGSGRHIKLLMEYGFNSYGIDYSEEAVKVARQNIGDCELLKGLINGDFTQYRFEKEFFDFIVAYGVIFLRDKTQMRSDLSKIQELLKPNGKMIINFGTKDMYFFKMGRMISEGTYILDERTGPYHGMTYTFLDLDEAKNILEETGFVIENIEKDDYWKNNLTERYSWWIFTVRKG